MAHCAAILLGDLSGLQAFLFAVPSGDGGQAKRLRARSFYLQLLTEVALLRVLETTGWCQKQVIFCGAGRFALQGPALDETQIASLSTLERDLGLWLHQHLGGLLTFSLAYAQGATADVALWRQAQHNLHRQKASPGRPVLQTKGRWNPSRLILPRVDLSSDDTPIVPAPTVMDEMAVGQALPEAHWLLLSHEKPAQGGIQAFDRHWALLSREARPRVAGVQAAFNLQTHNTLPPGIAHIPRQLARHLPRTLTGTPLTFQELARLAPVDPDTGDELPTGDIKIGILAMDVDRLGEAFSRQEQHGLEAVSELSRTVDAFFSQHIQQSLHDWHLAGCTYLLYAGGDDFIAVGPWAAMLELAGWVQADFAERFQSIRLTLSAGLAVCGPSYPIHRAVEQAQELLEAAKAKGGDRCAALGMIWRWNTHRTLYDAAWTWTRLVRDKVAERGWLQTLLQLIESAFHPQPLPPSAPLAAHQARRTASALAHARLAAFNKRAVRPKRGNAQASEIVKALIADFESRQLPTTRFMPAICRWALGLTRSKHSA